MRRITILTIILLGSLFAWAGLSLSPAHTSMAGETIPEATGPQAPNQPLPDLVLSEFTMVPTRPKVSEPVSFSIKIRNDGPGDAPGWRVNLYIDPSDQPPASTTTEIQTLALFVTRPPGTEDLVEFSGYTFATPGCQHTVYAWADPRQGITETDETNNMRAIHLCVDSGFAVSPGADAYEPDDTCSASVPIIATDGTPQVRSFAPITDVDYVRLEATEGMTYTVTAAGTGRDADPNLELSDSCNFVPPFGTTTRLQFAAPTSGTYYLKLSNAKSNPDPNQTTYQLTVRAEGQAPSGEQPIVQGIVPDTGRNDQNTNVTITGTQFVFPTMAEICLYRDGICAPNCTQLLDTTWASTQKLYAIVPPNLNDLGAYCVQATNPGGRKGALPNAFTMSPSQPDPRQVVSPQGYSDEPTDLHIYGFNFADGISLTIGTMGLENIKVINGTHVVATLPEGLTPGTHDLTASYASASGQLSNAFTVLPSHQANQDLYAQSNEFWLDPVAPRLGEPVSLGLVVHRISGTLPLTNLPVRFAVNGSTIGDVTIPSLDVDSQVSTGRVYYTPTTQGLYTFTALIDPDQTVSESTRANNMVTRTVSVMEAVSDNLAPQVNSFLIEGGKQQAVTVPYVKLSAAAHDVGGGATGVAEVRYIELEYNQGARLWVPVRDSNWLNYKLNSFNYDWTLTPVGGIHYIQAWAKDGVGNVSGYPHQQRINYLPATERLANDQVRIYRETLTAGEMLSVTLTPISGDPDLYIWPPDWETGGQPHASNQDGLAVDQVSFTAPVSGVYQIEVYGYVSSDYQLTFATSVIAADAGRLSPARPTGKHWPNVAPSVPVTSEPPRDVPSAGRFAQIYLPLVVRGTN